MKIEKHMIPDNQGKQSGYDVSFVSDNQSEHWSGKINGIPKTFVHLTKDEVVELASCFKCKSINVTHYPNMATRAIVIIEVKAYSGDWEKYANL